MGAKTLCLLGRPQAECSVVLVDDAAMEKLNRTYRGVAHPTDVLAFPMREGRFRIVSPELLGDVVISAETARRQAETVGGELGAELALLLIHGILHLVGYDHGDAAERRTMERKTQLILEACGIPVSASGPLTSPRRLGRAGAALSEPGRRGGTG